jgi:hypothetical protein
MMMEAIGSSETPFFIAIAVKTSYLAFIFI